MKQTFTILASLAMAFHAYSAETPPCTLAPTSQEEFDSQWKFFDVNNDGDPYRFVYSEGQGAFYTQNRTVAADDWIISPAVTLTAGKSYVVTATVQNLTTYSSDKQVFTVCCGMTQTPEGMTTDIFSESSLTKTSWPVEKEGSVSISVSGDYHIGLHLTSTSYMGDFSLLSFKVEEVVPLPGAVTDMEASAAPMGELKSVLSWRWPSVNNLGGDLTTLGGAKIYRSNSNASVASDTNLLATIDEGASPGTTAAWTDNSIPGPGIWYYCVVPFNAEGASTSAAPVAATPWVGPDSGVGNVTGLTAAPVADNEKAITLTWTPPSGSHGGYVDPAAIRYKICRSDNGATAITLEDEWGGDLPYTDTSIPGLGSYVYSIYTVYNGSTSFSSTKSEAVVTGGTMSLPYTNDFATNASIGLFSFFHTSGSRDWGHNATNKALNFWGNNSPGTSFAVLPVFALEAGKSYSVDFTTWVSSTRSPKNLSVRLGTTPTAEGLDETLWEQTISSTFKGDVQVPFNVPADGTYYIAFAVTDSNDSNDIYVNALSLTEVTTAPMPVSDAEVQAAAGGELKASLSWVNPRMTTAGTAMPVVDRIEIRRGDTLLETYRILEGGSDGFYDDTTIPEPGIYTYTITTYIADIAGEPVSVTSGWIGPDTPKAPASVEAEENADGTHTVTFTPVTEGEHGGYIDIENLVYAVSRNGDTLDSRVTGSPYTDTATDLPLGMYVYAVKAINGTIEGQPTEASPVRGGEALTLPYRPDFSSADDFLLWTFDNPEGKASNWKYDAGKQALTASFTAKNAWAFTPPIKMEEGTCKISFKATCYTARYPEDFIIYLTRNTNASDPDSVARIGDFHVETANYPAVTEVSFDVPSTGVYHVGYLLPSYQWTLSLTQADIEQTKVETPTGVENVTTDDGLRYDPRSLEIICADNGTTGIYSLQGALVMISTESRMKVGGLSAGAYIARFVTTDGKTYSIKFIR